MKKTLWILIGFCLMPSAFKAMAGADLVIYYDGRPGITYQDVPGLEYVFFKLDQLREEMQLSLEAEVGAQSSRISEQDLSIAEDLTFQLTGLTDQRVRVTTTGLGSHLYFAFKCPLNIKKAKIDVNLTRAVIRTDFDLITGSTPYNVDLNGFDIRVRPGISICSLASIFSALGFDLGEVLTALLEDTFRSEIENSLTNTFNLGGIGYSFLDLDPYIQAVPSALFQQIGVTKSEVLDVLRNPFSGISIKLKFDEDGIGYNGANDRLLIWIDVPWEDIPVATFNYTQIGDTEIRLDASGSYDPDGGSLIYEWYLDGYSITRINPILNYGFPSGGTKRVILTVTDDEGVRNTNDQYITLCGGSGKNRISICEGPAGDD